MAVTEDFRQDVLEVLNEYTAALENKTGQDAVPFMDEDELDETVAMPALKYTVNPLINRKAQPDSYRQVPMVTFFNRIDTLAGNVQEATDGLVVLRQETEAARDSANASAAAADVATQNAENVDATLDGMTVIITNRQGVSRQTNIGFEIYQTYTSVAQMNADAFNVPEGKFVMIATTDPTSPENARLYGKNSVGGFTFLSDLDQASSAAWADWLDNKKPEIEQATATANASAANADAKAALANEKAELANTKAELADEKATLANTEAANARSIYDTVRGWFNGDTGFKATTEGWFTDTVAEWDAWFSDTIATGVRKVWNTFYAMATGEWTSLKSDAVDATAAANNAAAVATSKGNTAEQQGNKAQSQGNVAESQGNIAEQKGSTAEAQGLTAQQQGLTAKTQGETAQAQGNVAETKGNTAEEQGNTAESKGNVAEQKGLTAEAKGNTAEAKGNTAQAQGNKAEQQGNAAEAQGDIAEQKGLAAEAQGNVAEQQGNTAEQKGLVAEQKGDYAKQQGDYSKNIGDHPPYIADGTQEKPGDGNYWYFWDYATQQYVKDAYAKGDDLHYDEMTDEEKQDIARRATETLVFATVETSEAIIDELV